MIQNRPLRFWIIMIQKRPLRFRIIRRIGSGMRLLDPDGWSAPPRLAGWGPKELALYADAIDLPSRSAPVTFLATLAFRCAGPLLTRIAGERTRAIIGGSAVHILSPLPDVGTLTLERTARVYALGALGIADLEFRFLSGDGLVGAAALQIWFPGEGRPGFTAPPRTPRPLTPQRPPDWSVDVATAPDQARRYARCGDSNPLHSDPAVAALHEFTEGRPILHGLCTFGLVGRAIATARNAPLASLSARFARPVWPGDTLRISGWNDAEHCLVRARTLERPDDDVLTAARATRAQPG